MINKGSINTTMAYSVTSVNNKSYKENNIVIFVLFFLIND